MSLRAAIRRREIWVEGASQWRNPEDDLPADFEASRDVHYQALGKPRDPGAFIADLRQRHAAALGRLNDALAGGTAGGVTITTRRGEPWIGVPHVPRQPEPANLKALKEEIARRWGFIDLLNLVKDADHVTGLTREFTSVASRQVRPSGSPRNPAAWLITFSSQTTRVEGRNDAPVPPGERGGQLRSVCGYGAGPGRPIVSVGWPVYRVWAAPWELRSDGPSGSARRPPSCHGAWPRHSTHTRA